jgi:hypothetical protein
MSWLDGVNEQQDFAPRRPGRPPWFRPTGPPARVAFTGNALTVPLEVAGRGAVGGLLRPTWDRDEYFQDWTPQSWGVESPDQTLYPGPDVFPT